MKKKGFTLVELLAVIVILAIILIIAVPQIMKTIEGARKGTFESNAKLIAGMAEKKALENETLGITDRVTCEQVAKLNTTDYDSCTIRVVDGEAKVSIAGKGKFEGMYICGGTKTNATVTNEECSTDVACFAYTTVNSYQVKDYDSCVSYTRGAFVDGWGYSEEELQSFCRGEVVDGYTFSENINGFIVDGDFTEQELIENNVIIKNSNNEATIIGYDIACGTDVVVPKTINGATVTTIGRYAFTRDGVEVTRLKQMNATNKVNSLINKYEDVDVTPLETMLPVGLGITSVKLPSSITSIGDSAFKENVITEIDFSSLTNLTTIGANAFRYNQITSIKLPSSVTSIGEYAFNINPLSNVNLGNTSATIGNCAFGLVSSIENHNIPNTYTCILPK